MSRNISGVCILWSLLREGGYGVDPIARLQVLRSKIQKSSQHGTFTPIAFSAIDRPQLHTP